VAKEKKGEDHPQGGGREKRKTFFTKSFSLTL
jgi:hypothetical protein